MRLAAALLLLLAFSVDAVAAAEVKDITDILPAVRNNGSTIEDSGLGKTGQNGETNPDTEHKVHEEGGHDNVIADNNKTDNSIEGTSTGRDDPVQKPKDKDENTTTTSSTDFLQDPLISGCDPSHRCLIEKQKFITCLKVSGDSSALSLLMDNKGVNPLDVSITAPDYVTIAEDTVHVEANDHNEVSVSVSDTMNDMAIVLKVAEETCRINLDTAVTRNRGRVIPMRLTSTYMLVPAFVLLGLVGLCVKLRKSSKQDGAPVYQKLDAPELPVSIGGKKEADQADQWDDNWGDDWDDEEAPSTPSNSMPNLSLKGLASRKSTKDGWKD
ncbi:hypothetical protein ACQ4PT_020646 [Festuca glaucescens]